MPEAGKRRPDEAAERDTPEVTASRGRMAGGDGQARYRTRARWIEWVKAGYRARGWHQVPVRGAAKVRTLVRWRALTRDMTRIPPTAALNAAFPGRLRLA